MFKLKSGISFHGSSNTANSRTFRSAEQSASRRDHHSVSHEVMSARSPKSRTRRCRRGKETLRLSCRGPWASSLVRGENKCSAVGYWHAADAGPVLAYCLYATRLLGKATSPVLNFLWSFNCRMGHPICSYELVHSVFYSRILASPTFP
jgi:hypothetical protein